MSGRVLVAAFALFVLIFGAALVYFQVYAYYERVEGLESIEVAGKTIPVSAYEGIDASSSGLKRRGCFRVDPADFEGLPVAQNPVPLTPPFWFDCFDTGAIAADLEAGRATAYLAAHEELDGIDRVVAVYPDGRAYEWRQLNDKYAE